VSEINLNKTANCASKHSQKQSMIQNSGDVAGGQGGVGGSNSPKFSSCPKIFFQKHKICGQTSPFCQCQCQCQSNIYIAPIIEGRI